jgi:hypothetical protein
MERLIAVIATFWILFAPLTAYWLMWQFAFRTEMMMRIGEALMALVLLGPPALCAILYLRYVRTNA